MKIERNFDSMGDRYAFDMGRCSASEGFAQVDTKQDAPYFGTWANPFTGEIVCYTEGDITIETAVSNADFIQGIKALVAWNKECGYWKGIDCGWHPDHIALRFVQLGLGDLLH